MNKCSKRQYVVEELTDNERDALARKAGVSKELKAWGDVVMNCSMEVEWLQMGGLFRSGPKNCGVMDPIG